MKLDPCSSLLLATIALAAAACSAPPSVAKPPAPPLPHFTLGDELALEGEERAAFSAYLSDCADDSASSSAELRKYACVAAFEMREVASGEELARWLDAASLVCGVALGPQSALVCRGVADLASSGPLEDVARARSAAARGCHVHGDYASCLTLQRLGGTVRTASAGPLRAF